MLSNIETFLFLKSMPWSRLALLLLLHYASDKLPVDQNALESIEPWASPNMVYMMLGFFFLSHGHAN